MKIEEVKRNLNRPVAYKGISNTYKLTACIIRREGKNFFYQAEILDTINGKSVIICRLEDIEVME